jgi:hypothetical protein
MNETRFEFDPEKNRRNLERHGVDLEWAQRLWDGDFVITEARPVLDETRFSILARIESKCYVAVFTMRDEVVRLISCHRADRRLERIYESEIEERKKGEADHR